MKTKMNTKSPLEQLKYYYERGFDIKLKALKRLTLSERLELFSGYQSLVNGQPFSTISDSVYEFMKGLNFKIKEDGIGWIIG